MMCNAHVTVCCASIIIINIIIIIIIIIIIHHHHHHQGKSQADVAADNALAIAAAWDASQRRPTPTTKGIQSPPVCRWALCSWLVG
jgi:hypothetical protein